MKIVVVAALTASSHIANALNTIKMAQGFARLGHDVTIICCRPAVKPVSITDLNRLYGLTEPIKWVQLPNRRLIGSGWFFALLAWRTTQKIQPSFVFARNYIFPWLTAKLNIPTVAESHAHIGNRKFAFSMLVRASHIPAFLLWVTISQRLANYYHACGVPVEKLMVLSDAVDLQLFRRPLKLLAGPFPQDQVNIVYAGHLYDYKGIPTILEAAKLLPQFKFHLVGGRPGDVARQQALARKLNINNVIFYGFMPQSKVPPFLWHADVLLLPPSQYHPSSRWTSPLKLGEYLASGTPVVATDILALRDWVTDDEVEFVPPDNPQALALGIETVLNNKLRYEQLRTRGLIKAESMSYKERAKIVLEKVMPSIPAE